MDKLDCKICEQIVDCVNKVSQYVVDNISFNDFSIDTYCVNIPESVHPLLSCRFNDCMSEECSSIVFDMLHVYFTHKFIELGYKEQIEEKITEMFPDKLAKVDSVDFYDEPEVDVSVVSKILNLETNESFVVNNKNFNYCGNSFTVDVRIKINE